MTSERRKAGHEITGLAGCEYVFTSKDSSHALEVIVWLNTCEAHGGAHHFAMTGEGRKVSMSRRGMECIVPLINSWEEEE